MKTKKLFFVIIACLTTLSFFFAISFFVDRSLTINVMRNYAEYTSADNYSGALNSLHADLKRYYDDKQEVLESVQKTVESIIDKYPVNIKSISFEYQTTDNKQWRPLKEGTSAKGITYIRPIVEYSFFQMEDSDMKNEIDLSLEYLFNYTRAAHSARTISSSGNKEYGFKAVGDDTGNYFYGGIKADAYYNGVYLATGRVEFD